MKSGRPSVISTNSLHEYNEMTAFAYHLGRGEIHFEPPKVGLIIAQSLKSLHASLRNLTWTTQQIATGDFSQKVSFMGEFSEAFNSMTEQLQTSFLERKNPRRISSISSTSWTRLERRC